MKNENTPNTTTTDKKNTMTTSSAGTVLSILLPLTVLLSNCIPTRAASGGSWKLLSSNIGVSAMHMQLLRTDRVVIYDRTDYGLSNISLAAGKPCRDNDTVVKPTDCSAHSVEYDVSSNTVRPLTVLTNVWCSSGAVSPDGDLVQAGGFNDGDDVVRIYKPCTPDPFSQGDDDLCGDWQEITGGLAKRRWYATSQILPDGRMIIVGGRRQFNYEFYPKSSSSEGAYPLHFLAETYDPKIENNLYPFVFLNTDGNLFIFANNRAVLFDYSGRQVLKTYPPIPGGDPRSYPSSGSAVLLPLTDDAGSAEVLVCGGAPKGAFVRANNSDFTGALNTCTRIRINDPDPEWAMERMPTRRVMGDMVLLPDGNVLIINGAGSGTAGWEMGRDPVLAPVVYRPGNRAGSRFEVQNPSSTPRMYHSSAILLRDGRVLIGGSNPHVHYNFTNVMYPTDLSLEAFSPSYIDPYSAYSRPRIVFPFSQYRIEHNQNLTVRFLINPLAKLNSNSLTVTMVSPPLATHSYSMGQRLLVLAVSGIRRVGWFFYDVRVVAPVSVNFAPSGYYMMFVVHEGVPSEGVWVKIR